MPKALHPRDDIDNMCWKSVEKDDTPALKVSLTHRDNIKRAKKKIITATKYSTNKTSINRKQWLENKKVGRKQLYRYFKWQTSEILL